MCSEICTPLALVLMGLNGPPVLAPGLRSQMSMVLGPPPIHSRMAALCRLRRSSLLAARALVKLMAGPAMAPAAARWPMKCRRDMPNGVAVGIRMGSSEGSVVESGWWLVRLRNRKRGALRMAVVVIGSVHQDELVAVEQDPEHVLQGLDRVALA